MSRWINPLTKIMIDCAKMMQLKRSDKETRDNRFPVVTSITDKLRIETIHESKRSIIQRHASDAHIVGIHNPVAPAYQLPFRDKLRRFLRNCFYQKLVLFFCIFNLWVASLNTRKIQLYKAILPLLSRERVSCRAYFYDKQDKFKGSSSQKMSGDNKYLYCVISKLSRKF